jgi:glycosyltransferase involved in cell wall biosynthesis
MASILHVVSYFPPNRIGGLGEVVAQVHRALLAAGHRSHVVTTGRARGEPNVTRVARGAGGFALASARALSLARDADLVHLHHGEGLGLLAAMRLARVRRPVMLTLHVGIPQLAASLAPYHVGPHRFARATLRRVASRALAMPVRAWLDRAALALADDVSFIARSAAVDNLGAQRGARARVIYNGVESAVGDAVAAPVDLLFVGANTSRKRVELLPLILHAVRRALPTARLRIIGFGREANPELLAAAQALGVLAAIEFAGPLRADEVTAHYRAAKVLVVPSAYEGLPMVILEAFAAGLPCVATAVSGHPEVVRDGETGYLVPLDDVEACAAHVVALLQDDARRAAFARAARQTVLGAFTVQRQVEEYLAWYATRLSVA